MQFQVAITTIFFQNQSVQRNFPNKNNALIFLATISYDQAALLLAFTKKKLPERKSTQKEKQILFSNVSTTKQSATFQCRNLKSSES